MEVRPFHPADLDAFVVQPAQAAELAAARREYGANLRAYGPAWSGLVGGTLLIITGLVDLGGGRALAWSYLSVLAGRHMTALTRAARAGLAHQHFRRVEMTARADFPAAARWAALLGFAYEGRLRSFFDDGGDADLFAMVQP